MEPPRKRRREEPPLFDPTHYEYSELYEDDVYIYRHVTAPEEYHKWIPRYRLLTEAECLNIGITMSPGWEHYDIHRPEPHIFLFRRKKQINPKARNGRK